MNTNITIGFLLNSLIQRKEIELIQTIIFLILSVTAGPLWRQHSAMRWDINFKLVALLCLTPFGCPCTARTWLPLHHPCLAARAAHSTWNSHFGRLTTRLRMDAKGIQGTTPPSPHRHYHHGSPSANFTRFKIGLRFFINCQKEKRERGSPAVASARAFISYSIRRKCAWNFLYACMHSFPLCVEAFGLDGSHCLVCYVWWAIHMIWSKLAQVASIKIWKFGNIDLIQKPSNSFMTL
jgi:hypothetical protein